MWIGTDGNADSVIDNPYTINGTAISVDSIPSLLPNTQIPDWYCFNPIIVPSTESTNSVTESEETTTDTDSFPIEFALGIGAFITGIPIILLVMIKKRKV